MSIEDGGSDTTQFHLEDGQVFFGDTYIGTEPDMLGTGSLPEDHRPIRLPDGHVAYRGDDFSPAGNPNDYLTPPPPL